MNAGELKEYLLEEVNVQNLETCDLRLRYCTLRAEPDYPSLGKRLGKGMAKVGKAIKGMTTQQILDFEAQGRIELEGESVESGEIRVGGFDKLTEVELHDLGRRVKGIRANCYFCHVHLILQHECVCLSYAYT